MHSKLKIPILLQDLIKHLDKHVQSFNLSKDIIDAVTINSKYANKNTLFLVSEAAKDYIQETESVVLTENHDLKDRPGIIVKNYCQALPEVLNYLFNSPAEDLYLTAVTGTNGKTSINWMIYHALKILGGNPLRIGTLGIKSAGIKKDVGLTSPDVITNYAVISEGKKQGVDNVVMEVSAHALSQHRVIGLDFYAAIYTNLTRDHLDYYKSMEEYFQAKKILFDDLLRSSKKEKVAIINTDCDYGKRLIENLSNISVCTYGRKEADLLIADCRHQAKGSSYSFTFNNQKISFTSPIIGHYNEYNFAAVVALLLNKGFGLSEIEQALSKVPPVPGRLELIICQGKSTFVDYAHTPDALVNALKALRLITKGKLWVVFGCGGDRDRGKRPEMGKACNDYADYLVVTSDNPRTEDPQAIINDILQACQPEIIEVNREKAIMKALNKAAVDDVILIAGKGHENYQERGKEKIPYSDQLVLKRINEQSRD